MRALAIRDGGFCAGAPQSAFAIFSGNTHTEKDTLVQQSDQEQSYEVQQCLQYLDPAEVSEFKDVINQQFDDIPVSLTEPLLEHST